MDAHELWASKFAQEFAEEKAKEDARREQAFLDLPIEVGAEQLRAMTPVDLLILNGIESPFVCPGEPTAADVAVFLWVLNTENDGTSSWRNQRRKRAMTRRLRPLIFEVLVLACSDYVNEIFQDAPTSTGPAEDERRPLGTCFIAPLVMNMALETGWGQAEILHTPLPRLFQYRKALRARQEGREFIDHSPSDRLTGLFLAELNGAPSQN